jgi:hypothetical protein
MIDRALRNVMRAVLLGCVALAAAGCGSSNDGTMIEVDEEQEKALTDSMRGYYEKEGGP